MFRVTEGITEPKFTRDPLGTEGEMTPGPDDENPYDEQGTFGGDSQPQLPRVVGDDVPLEADETVDKMVDAAGDRNMRLDSVFEFGEGAPGSFPGTETDQGDQFHW